MFNYFTGDAGMKDIVIFDLDGTLGRRYASLTPVDER